MCTSQPHGGPQGLSQEKAFITGLQVTGEVGTGGGGDECAPASHQGGLRDYT